MTPPLRVAITAADVGRRVTVRFRLPASEEGHRYSDVVGRLVGWSEGVLEVVRRDGTTARIRETDVAAAKALPETPPGRRSVD